ncbi:TolC family protein [Vibrio sp. 2026]|nr:MULTISPECIES: TolC family protein [Vibrio]MDG2624941.1 TolC family protein [Vibrio parahaemolyticus]MCA2482902.1 TolC family protein [Vibrio alginolyticus]MCR9391137.1 TolC family protein [Vibrio alginolyticus]MCS0243086.1 TolC family protein [Vibrio alginolyticus]MCY9818130.1 TolC family protein [Vibrio alginolyticus]
MPALSHTGSNATPQTIVASTQQLNALIEAALANDTSRSQYAAQSQAMRETGVASSTLMDPKLKVGFGGLPVDSFKFDEDPMTNISVGLMQQFERGATLDLNQRKANQQADGMAYQVQVREREVANSITQLWLELGYLQYAETLIESNQRFMVEMEQYIQTNYSIGKSEAQDLLNTQLQVNKLDEKLQSNQQMQNRAVAQLSEWLGSEWLNHRSIDSNQAGYQLDWSRLNTLLEQQTSNTQYYSLLNQHPMAQMADANISANRTQVEVAEQSYTPQFGVEVMYAYRQSDNMKGEPASDLLSAYLTMDIPLFTDNRQDKNVAAAQYQVGAAQYQKDTLLAQMNAQVNALMTDRMNLTERIQRYQERLLPQSKARIEAVERGYQNNTAQFGDVITASTDELALQMELARLITDMNQVNSKLSMLLGGFEYQVSAPNTKYKEQ